MRTVPFKMPKVLALATFAAIGALAIATPGSAEASPAKDLKGIAKAASPVETAGYYRRYRRTYIPESYAYEPKYRTYSNRNYGNGHDEIRELQRLYPETNWPPSMRYHQY